MEKFLVKSEKYSLFRKSKKTLRENSNTQGNKYWRTAAIWMNLLAKTRKRMNYFSGISMVFLTISAFRGKTTLFHLSSIRRSSPIETWELCCFAKFVRYTSALKYFKECTMSKNFCVCSASYPFKLFKKQKIFSKGHCNVRTKERRWGRWWLERWSNCQTTNNTINTSILHSTSYKVTPNATLPIHKRGTSLMIKLESSPTKLSRSWRRVSTDSFQLANNLTFLKICSKNWRALKGESNSKNCMIESQLSWRACSKKRKVKSRRNVISWYRLKWKML